MKSENSLVRRGLRVIRMVSDLHRMGYQRLRIMPYMHPLAWRLAVAPMNLFTDRNGACLKDVSWNGIPVYSSEEGANYFDWQDAQGDNARALAEKFLQRFPDTAERGKGRDWQYSGWLSELIGVLEGGDLLPVVYWEHMKDSSDQLEFLPLWSMSGENTWNDGSAEIVAALHSRVKKFPLPPTVPESD